MPPQSGWTEADALSCPTAILRFELRHRHLRDSSFLATLPRAYEAVTKPCRPFGTRIKSPTLPSTPPSAACWAKLFRACGTRISWLLCHRRESTPGFVTDSEGVGFLLSSRVARVGRVRHGSAKKEQMPRYARHDKRVEGRSAAVEEQIPRASAAEARGMTNE